MRIVINRCYGGFGVSVQALIELINVKSAIVKVYDKAVYCGSSTREIEFIDAGAGYSMEQYGPTVLYKGDKVYAINSAHELRNDPHLIEVVERLGDKANGDYSKLRIVEIPDGVEWEIDEYDGMEKINESHRSWS